MKTIKTSVFKRLSTPDFIMFGQNVVASMTGNPHFPGTTEPPLADVSTAIDDLAMLAIEAENRDHMKIVARNTQRDVVTALLVQLAAYVLAHCEQRNDIIESTGFIPGRQGGHAQPVVPAAPENVRSKSLSSAIELQWDPVASANSYYVMRTIGYPTQQSAWETVASSTRSKIVLGSEPGQIVSVRVIALGAAGASQPSAIISCVASV